MVKWLDGIVLIFALLATLAQLLFLLSPGLGSSDFLRPISLTIILMSFGYVIFRGAFPSEEPGAPQSSQELQSPPRTSESAEQAYKYFAERYGIGYDSLQIQWFIKGDGSAMLERIVEVEAYSEIEQLDTYLLIPEKSSESDEERIIDVAKVESLSPSWNVTLTDRRKDPRYLSALITISPPLKRGEKMRYKMVEQLPPGLYAINRTEAELAHRETPYDYCGWNINRPTRKVSLQVEFPEFIKPQVFSSEVRYASASGFASIRLHYEEQQRFRPVLTLSPKGDSYILRLDVDHPMIGLIYILRWQPVPVD